MSLSALQNDSVLKEVTFCAKERSKEHNDWTVSSYAIVLTNQMLISHLEEKHTAWLGSKIDAFFGMKTTSANTVGIPRREKTGLQPNMVKNDLTTIMPRLRDPMEVNKTHKEDSTHFFLSL